MNISGHPTWQSAGLGDILTLPLFHSTESGLKLALFPLIVEFREASFHHILDAKLFHAQQIENHRVSQTELRFQFERFAQHDSMQIRGLVDVAFAQDYHHSRFVETWFENGRG